MLRKIVIELSEDDYHDFARVANDFGLSVEEKIYEIVDVYLLVQRKKFKTYRINHEKPLFKLTEVD